MVYVQEAWFSTWRMKYEARSHQRMVGFSIRWLVLAAIEFRSPQWFYYWSGQALRCRPISCLFLSSLVPLQAKLEAALIDNREHLDNLKRCPPTFGLCLTCFLKMSEKNAVESGKYVSHFDLGHCDGGQ